MKILLELGVPDIPGLATIDEFPRTMIGEPGTDTQMLLDDIKNSVEQV